MRLDFNFVFQSLDKTDVHEYDGRGIRGNKSYVHKWLASRLANWPEAKEKLTIFKYNDLAERLNDNGWLEVDRSDRKLIHDLIEKDPRATVLMQNQMLKVIDTAVEKEAGKPKK